MGVDTAAGELENILTEGGIDCEVARAKDRPTITKTRVQSRGQQLLRFDQENVIPMPGDAMVNALMSSLDKAGAVVLSDYGKGTLAEVRELIDRLEEALP